MTNIRAISIRSIGIILCITFLVSCSSNNKVVSAKRKYRKGWFLNRSGDINAKGGLGKDSAAKQVYAESQKPEKTNVVAPAEKAQEPDKKQIRQARRDSLRAVAMAKKADKKQKKEEAKKKNKIKGPPEPPDYILMRLLILIVVLTGFSILVTGLITPIVAWGITRNFLLSVGVILTFVALFLSVNTTQGINPPKDGIVKPYNIGKPAFIVSLWAIIPTGFLCVVVKTSLLANVFITEVATIGMFVAGACIFLSLIMAIKALFVNDIHKKKAVLAIFIDALLIAAAIWSIV